MNPLKNIKNDHLLEKFSGLVAQEKEATAAVVRYLSEIFRRRLFAKEGYSSLFAYLTEKYHYSGSAAYRRIQAAKVSLKFPEIIDLLADGKLNLVSASLIEPHLTFKNGKELIQKVLGKTKNEIEYIISNIFVTSSTQPNKDKIRRLPVIKKEVSKREPKSSFPFTAAAAVADENMGKKNEIEKAEEKQIVEIRRVKIEFAADEKLVQKIDRAKEVLRHKYPKASLEDIFDEALEALLEKKAPERKIARISGKLLQSKGAQSEKKSVTRYVPHEIRRAVWNRDQGQCVYQSPNGKKCGEKSFLESDHIHPFALGGKSTVENLQLLCKTHNAYRAQQTFGMFR